MNSFGSLHPICIFTYFVTVILLVLICQHPVMMIFACIGALFFLLKLESENTSGLLRMLLPMVLLIAFTNILLSHKGITRLFVLFGQWVTLESICYGITSGLSLTALVLWFSCYQKIMTSDKFLYLFGKAAPASALLISMTLNLVPKLQGQLRQIQECQEMLSQETSSRFGKFKKALRHTSTLLGWSLENTVEQADSMKARGYGIRRRTTFHLFRFESRDAKFLTFLLLISAVCIAGRICGYGTMEFYPRMDRLFGHWTDCFYTLIFLALVMIPGIMEWKEELLWRYYDLKQ